MKFERRWDHQSSLTIGFVDNLSDADDFAFEITDRHRENDIRFVSSLKVDFAVEAWILVSVFDVDDFFRFGHVTGDADTEGYDELLGLSMLNGIVER